MYRGNNKGPSREPWETPELAQLFEGARSEMSRLVTTPTKGHVRPAKTQVSLVIRPVWSESSLSAWRKLGSLATHWAQSEDSDQLGGCLGWSESSLGAHVSMLVYHEAAQMFLIHDRGRPLTPCWCNLYRSFWWLTLSNILLKFNKIRSVWRHWDVFLTSSSTSCTGWVSQDHFSLNTCCTL